MSTKVHLEDTNIFKFFFSMRISAKKYMRDFNIKMDTDEAVKFVRVTQVQGKLHACCM